MRCYPSFCLCELGSALRLKFLRCPKYNHVQRKDEYSMHLATCPTCQAARKAVNEFAQVTSHPDLTVEEMEAI